MDNIYIKKFSLRFIAYLIIVLCFSWILPIAIAIAIWVRFDPGFPMVVNVILDIALVAIILYWTYLLFEILPYKRSKKLVQKFKEGGFPFSYCLEYKHDYWIVDEENGRLAVVAVKNPFKIQVIDASYIDGVTIHPNLNAPARKQYEEIGLEIQICGKKYLAYTYNGRGYRSTFAIPANSEEAEMCLRSAHELGIYIMKAKEVAVRNKNHG